MARKEEKDLIEKLNTHCNECNPTEEDKHKIMEFHNKLGAIFVHKAKGAYIRSKAKWIEGEQNTPYFCKLEKTHREKCHQKIIN